MEQMCFSGVAGCPNFRANPFRKNICSLCQSRIQDHSGASDTDIANAIEYSADNIPTLILQRSCRSRQKENGKNDRQRENSKLLANKSFQNQRIFWVLNLEFCFAAPADRF